MKKLHSSIYSSLVLCLLATVSTAQMGPSHDFYADSPYSLHYGDIDNDGDQDILAGTRDGLVWYENLNGLGNFGQFTMINGLGGAVHCADIDGDGLTDLVSSSNFDMQLLWYKNLGGGNFSPANIAATAFAASYIESADIDGDGDADLLCTGINNGVHWYENTDGTGTFSLANIIAMPSFPIKAQAGDMDGDGDKDVYWRSGNGQLKWAENTNGNGVFGATVGITLDGEGAAYAADIDADGDLDILTVNNNELSAKRNTAGAGIFGSEEVIGAAYTNARSTIAADLDKDGDNDVLAISMGSDEVRWHENLHGEGVFGQAQIISDTWADPISISAVDMDGDGDLDVLIASDADDRIAWYENLENAQNIISGRVYMDLNQDGNFNNTDYGLSGEQVVLDNGAVAFTNLSGVYQFPVNNGTFTVGHQMNNDWALTSTNLSYTVSITTNANSSLGNDFGFEPVVPSDEAYIDLLSSQPHCSFAIPYWLTITNVGTRIAHGDVKFDHDDLLTYVWSEETPISTNGGEANWTFEDLLPTQSRTIVVYMMMPDFNSMGTILEDHLFVNLRDPNTNSIIAQYDKPLWQIMECSYDPNDKLVLPVGETEQHFTRMGEEFEYTVRFQNTGSGEALNVHIADTLDPSLDWTTFEVVSSSHPVTTNVSDEGLVMFEFENIMLPDSSTNEPGSHGAVKFTIRHLNGIADQTVISNTAHIFFDLNPAIVTNTVFNTMVPPMWTGVEEFGREENVTVFPNPFTTSTTLQFEQEAGMSYKLSLMDVSGRVVRTYTDITGGSLQINKGDLTPGIYHFHLIGKNRTHSITSGKFLIQ